MGNGRSVIGSAGCPGQVTVPVFAPSCPTTLQCWHMYLSNALNIFWCSSQPAWNSLRQSSAREQLLKWTAVLVQMEDGYVPTNHSINHQCLAGLGWGEPIHLGCDLETVEFHKGKNNVWAEKVLSVVLLVGKFKRRAGQAVDFVLELLHSVFKLALAGIQVTSAAWNVQQQSKKNPPMRSILK